MPRDKDVHTRIRTCLRLHSLTGFHSNHQSEETGLPLNTLHSVNYANFNLTGSITHVFSR